MRTRLAVAAMLLVGVSGTLGAQDKKAPPPDVGAGRVAWFDLTTTDLAKSREFYGKLFGWTFTALKGTDLAVEIVSRELPIGTLRGSEGPISLFNGVVYIQADDVRASCDKAKELGATVVPGFPFNLPDGSGAICLFADPVGHPMGIYSRAPLPAAVPASSP